jgi:hypothetical protein
LQLSNPDEKRSGGIVNFVAPIKQIEAQSILSNAPLLPRDDYHGHAEE